MYACACSSLGAYGGCTKLEESAESNFSSILCEFSKKHAKEQTWMVKN